MSINRLVSIKNPIINAFDLAGLDHDSHLPLFTQWATEAEKEIGSYYQFTRQWAVVDVKGCSAQLPCNAIKIEGSIIGDHAKDCCSVFGNVFGGTSTWFATQAASGFLVVDNGSGDSSTNYSSVPFHIQNNKLIFDTKYKFSQLTIQYLGYQEDCDGFMEVGENHVKAITHYILYNWCLRRKKKGGGDFNEMQWHYKEWDRLCAHSRALDGELTDSDREEIAQLYHNPLAGRGLTLGMQNPNNYGYGRTGNY